MTANDPENRPAALSAARQQLEQALPTLSEAAAAQVIAMTPGQFPTPTDAAALRAALEQHASALASAFTSAEPATFSRHIQSTDPSAGGYEAVRVMIEVLGQMIRKQLGDPVWLAAKPALDPALEWLLAQVGYTPPSAAQPAEPEAIVRAFTTSILKGNRIEAEKLVFDAMARGYTIRDVYLRIIQPSLYEVGRLWETGQVSIPQEYLATAITQSVLSTIYARVELPANLEQRAIVACLEDNFHEIGPRMLADFLQMAGYNTRFLGTNTSPDCLIEMIQQHRPGVIGLPATTENHVEGVKAAIERVRADFTSYRPVIMVGGLAFNLVDGLWRTTKADLWRPDGAQAVDELVGSSNWS